MFMVTRSFGLSDANFVCADSEHANAFALWHRAKETDNELLKANAGTYRTQREQPLIVVVDDEPVVAITLAEILRRDGKIAVWFTEPLRALDYLWEVPVDLLLSDITMPTMDGVSLATQAQAVRPSCEILLLSALAREAEVIERVARLGIKVQLELKPLRVPCLLLKVDRLLVAGMVNLALAAEL
jgi:CheY-like chemotaxis protein